MQSSSVGESAKNTQEAHILRLPEELLLNIALSLPDSFEPRHLKNLCLVSRKFRPAAQEALHSIAQLLVSCGCHPKINAVLKLLRTIYSRPDLATKIRWLRFQVVRKSVSKICQDKSFNLASLRERGFTELRKLDYGPNHPWWRSLENDIESSFAGLLFLQLPNLVGVNFWVKDHVRGPPSSECVTGLFGVMSIPAKVLQAWKGLYDVTTSDTHMLKCGVPFENLVRLDLKSVSIATVLRLNGRGCLQGAGNLQNLALTVSIQFVDPAIARKAEVQLRDLFDALECRKLQELNMTLINDGYHLGEDVAPQFDPGYFIDQIPNPETLISLKVVLDGAEDEIELDWLIDLFTEPKNSWKKFTRLTTLAIPQVFLFMFITPEPSDGEHTTQPKGLPPNLESLEIFQPVEELERWVSFFKDEHEDRSILPSFKQLVLTCQHDVGTDPTYFTGDVHEVWSDLSRLGIEGFVSGPLDIKFKLSDLYNNQNMSEGSCQPFSDSVDGDMPGLVEPMDVID